MANPVLVALDTTDAAAALRLAEQSAPYVGGIKLGLEFFNANGAAGVRHVAAGRKLFLDLKLHDIPNTVAAAVRAVAPLQPALLTLHASGGQAMMRAAVQASRETAPATRLVGVTVLTHLDEAELAQIGQLGPITEQARRLALLAQESGLDGVVCSAWEVAALRAACGPDFVLIVPGIRPAGAAPGDQKRVMTPTQAMDLGATYLVIGRPITEASSPAAAARAIAEELARSK